MFACLLLIRRPRRLRHLRRLAVATAQPTTRTLLPGHLAPARPATVLQLPHGFELAGPACTVPAAPDEDERTAQSRLQTAIDGRAHTAAAEARHD